MKSLSVKTSSLLLVVGIFGASAFAQTPTATATNTSVATVAPASETKFKLPVKLMYDAWLYGPGLNDLSGGYTVTDSFSDTDDKASQDPISMRHRPGIGRKLTDRYTLSAHLEFFTKFTDPARNGNTKGFFWSDCFLKLSRGNQALGSIGGNEIGIAGDFRYYAPTSKFARSNNTLGALRLSVNPSIKFGKSPFSITSVNYVKVWGQTRATSPISYDQDGQVVRDGRPTTLLELYTGPQLNAQVHSRVNLFVMYEAAVQKYNVTRENGLTWTNGSKGNAFLTDIEPGADITISDNLTLTPFLNWYTAAPIKTTSINLNISASL